MLSYKDKTFCASPNCINECGRKITDTERSEAMRTEMFVSYAYFCGEPMKACRNDVADKEASKYE